MPKLVVALLILAVSLPAGAQPAGKGPGTPSAADRRQKVKEHIRALRAYTLTEQLDLDEATAARLFPALAKYDEEFEKLLQARADLQKRLAAAGGLNDARQVDKLIDEAIANRRALWETEDKRLQQLRKILSPAQTARALVVLPAMERKIQHELRRAAQPAQPDAKAPPRNSDDDGMINPFARKKERDAEPRLRPAPRLERHKTDDTLDPFDSDGRSRL
jgi:hypothetical protein